MNGFCEAAIVCGGNINDPGLCLYLAKVKKDLQKVLHADRDELQIKKVERWNSVRVTFRLPQDAVQRLRSLAERNPEALRSLGILSVQLDELSSTSSAPTANVVPVAQPPPPPNVAVTNLNKSSSSSFNNIDGGQPPAGLPQQSTATYVGGGDVDLLKRIASGIGVGGTPNPNVQQHQQYYQGQLASTSNCYPSRVAVPPQQQSPPAHYANFMNVIPTPPQQQQPPAGPVHYQQRHPAPPLHQQQRGAYVEHFPSQHTGTSSAGVGQPNNNSPLLVTLLQQHSPPPSNSNSQQPQQMRGEVVVAPPPKTQKSKAKFSGDNPPQQKKRRKPTKKEAKQAQQTPSTSVAYNAYSGDVVQVSNYSSQTNLLVSQQQQQQLNPQQYQQHQTVPTSNSLHAPQSTFNPNAASMTGGIPPAVIRQQQQQSFGGAEAESPAHHQHHQQPHRVTPSRSSMSSADREATISSAIDSVVSRVSFPSTPTVGAQQQKQFFENNDEQSPISNLGAGHIGHPEGVVVSDLNNIHQSQQMIYEVGQHPSATSAQHQQQQRMSIQQQQQLHSSTRITTPTNHILDSQLQQSAAGAHQQQASPFFGGGDPSTPTYHHGRSSSSSASSPWSHSTPPIQLQQQQQPTQQQQLAYQQLQMQGFNTNSHITTMHPQQQQQQQSDVFLSPPPSYGAVCQVTNYAVHSQTKVKASTAGGGGMLVNGGGNGGDDDQNALALWRHDVGDPNLAAVLNCHDNELRWTDHDYLSDPYLHQQAAAANNAVPEFIFSTATATASAAVVPQPSSHHNPLLKTHATATAAVVGQWNVGALNSLPNAAAAAEVQDAFHGNGGELTSSDLRQAPLWHSMTFDNVKNSGTVGLRPSAPGGSAQSILPANIIHSNYSPG